MTETNEIWEVQWTDDQWYSLHGEDFYVQNVYGSRTNVPFLRGDNIALYARPGRLHQPKMADQRTLSLQGWVSNLDSNGDPYPVPCDQGLNTNWRFLRRLLWRENGQQFPLRRTWYDETGTLVTAEAMVEYDGGLDLSDHVIEAGAWTCDLTMADPYFYGPVENTSLSLDTPTILTNTGDVAAFKMTLDFIGELGNPKLTNSTPDPDVFVQVGSAISSSDSVFLDVENFTALRDSDQANFIGAVTRSGSRTWMILSPGDNTLELTASSGSGSVDITWQPGYL